MFGFFKGKITLTLEKYQFAPGEEMKGHIVLELKKSVQASGLVVQLVGTRRMVMNNDRNNIRHETIFDFSMPIDGAKEYPAGQALNYDFSLKIPDTILQNILGDTTAQIGITGAGGIRLGASFSSQRVDWQVIVRLDSPGFDITRKVQVSIT